jgi:hypothetical protein
MTEEWYRENDRLRSFVDTVDEVATEHEEIPDLLATLHDPFRELLTDDEWLLDPDDGLVTDGYDDKGEMGGEIAQWLLYRQPENLGVHARPAAGRRDVRPRPPGLGPRRQLRQRPDRGSLPPHGRRRDRRRPGRARTPADRGDARGRLRRAGGAEHRHVLGADVGCIQRHQFDPDDAFVEVFQSHDTNVRCEEALAPPDQHGHPHTHSHGH